MPIHLPQLSNVKKPDVYIFLVYTGSGDGSVMCFDSKSGSLMRAFKGHTAAINAIQVFLLTYLIGPVT